jgi:hypothetical protein
MRTHLVIASGILASCGLGVPGAWHAAQAQEVAHINAGIVAIDIPGAAAIAQVGTFLNVPPQMACANPIPSKFPAFIQPGVVLDPNRILVAADRTSAPRLPSAWGRKVHSCRSTRTGSAS